MVKFEASQQAVVVARPRAGPEFGWVLVLLAAVSGWLFWCNRVMGADSVQSPEVPALKRMVVSNYATIVSTEYQDALAAARKLDAEIGVLLDKPSEHSLKAARRAWIEARVPYSQSEAFRFYDGPIDQVEAKLNSWPIDEQYIDYVAENPAAGIINDPAHFPTLGRELILALNEKEGKKNISTGFHAIEFLLWGQDLSPTGPGERSWQDYADGAKNAERRRQFLRIISSLLVEHLQTLVGAWGEGQTNNYRAGFLAMNEDAALAYILKGIGSLSGPELAGERLTVPYETKLQEEEQDCFSDNTRNDLINDALGIQNVYLGRYESISGRKVIGPGLRDLLTKVDPGFGEKLASQIENTVSCVRQIPQPFDQAILGSDANPGRNAIKRAIMAFQTQSDLIAQAAHVLSIRLNL